MSTHHYVNIQTTDGEYRVFDFGWISQEEILAVVKTLTGPLHPDQEVDFDAEEEAENPNSYEHEPDSILHVDWYDGKMELDSSLGWAEGI